MTSQPEYLPTTQELHDVFAEEIASLGGKVTDVYDDHDRLFARAVLSIEAEVLPRDKFNPGIAVRAVGSQIEVQPYVLRQVCTNGAIGAQTLESQRFRRPQLDVIVPTDEVMAVLDLLRGAVHACAANAVFADAAMAIRRSSGRDAELSFLLSIFARQRDIPRDMLQQIFDRFAAERDRSDFGLMNAVTSVARDTKDPEIRWRLEQIGAAIPARLHEPRSTAPISSIAHADATEPLALVDVE